MHNAYAMCMYTDYVIFVIMHVRARDRYLVKVKSTVRYVIIPDFLHISFN